MNREFHIDALPMENRFILRSMGEGCPREFTSLFLAALHVRMQPDCGDGTLVIHDEAHQALNRIPLRASLS